MENLWTIVGAFGGAQAVLIGLTAYLGGIWAKRILSRETEKFLATQQTQRQEFAAEQQTKQQEFSEHLANIRGQIDKELSGYQTVLKDELERDRSYGVLSRDRVVKHLEQALSAFWEWLALLQSSRKASWIGRQEVAELELQFIKGMSRVHPHIRMLLSLDALPKDVGARLFKAMHAVRTVWDRYMGAFSVYKAGDPDDSERWEAVESAGEPLYEGIRHLEECGMDAFEQTVVPR